jgi:hypothetical protein
VVVLDVLEGSEGDVNSVLLLHVELLSPVPVTWHLDELVRGLDLENGDTGDGSQLVLGEMLRLGCLLNFVLLVTFHFNFVLEKVYSGDDYWRILGILPRLVNQQWYLGKLVGDLVLDTGGGGQHLLGVLLRLVGLLTLVVLGAGVCGQRLLGVLRRLGCLLTLIVLGKLLVNLVPTQAWFLLASDLTPECITK